MQEYAVGQLASDSRQSSLPGMPTLWTLLYMGSIHAVSHLDDEIIGHIMRYCIDQINIQ